jgi:hypothetical protein
VESPLQWWVEVSISSLGRSTTSRPRTTIELPVAGITSSLTHVPTRLRLGHLSKGPKPLTHCQARRGDEGAHFKHHVCNPHHGGHNDRERCSLCPEEPEPITFKSNMCDTCYAKHFWHRTTSSSMMAKPSLAYG